jgi:predicted RNase H-like HicB family nuclease
MKYQVALGKTEKGFSVSRPGLPGCRSPGETEREVPGNIAEAIGDYLVVTAELAAEEQAELREMEGAA